MNKFMGSLLTMMLLTSASINLIAQAWIGDLWQYRREITISNPGGAVLTDYQVKINLDDTNFAFLNAKPDGSDIRITANDGLTFLPYWIESWNQSAEQATIWMKVPSLPSAGTTVFIYYGNASATNAANGESTFQFFDDFESSVISTPGYYNFGPASTIMNQEPAWGESSAPHTLSVVKAPTVGAYNNYIYYGYYGPQNSGYIGIAGSNDLINWNRFPYNPPPAASPNNPIFVGDAVRWPSVYLNETENIYYMVHTVNYGGPSYLVYRTSFDGLIWSSPTTIIQDGFNNQNPSLFHDPISGKYYLYWYRGESGWRIMAREAETVAELASAVNQTLLVSPTVLAAPQVLYYDNTYFLSTEILEGVWKVRIYSGNSPLGPFTILPGNPVLNDGCACLFQHLFNGSIYEYYCKETSGTWTLDMRVVDPSTGRINYEVGEIDPTKWASVGGSWNAISSIDPHGDQGIVAEGITSTNAILKSTFSGSDYILEGYGKQISGRVWGFGIRTTDTQNGYTLNLYEDLDATNNLYYYRWFNNTTIEVMKTSLGPITPNAWYKLMVKAHGSNFDIYFNDALQTSANNSDYLTGSIALYGEANTNAQFDDIRVRKYANIEPVSSVGEEQNNPLPVELSTFSAIIIGSSVKLNWKTETEINNFGFEVERTSPHPSPYEGKSGEAGRGWEKIGFVNGSGNSNSPRLYNFNDDGLMPGKYSYRLKQIDNDGQFEYSKTVEVDFNSPKKFELSQNYPNPFNPATSIRYEISSKQFVMLKVYDVLGKEVAILVNENKEAGSYSVNFNASKLPSGVYIYKMQAGDFVQTRKMILIQ